MKRDFEKEFKGLKLAEVPDLWERIEAALPEKTLVPENNIAPAKNSASAKRQPSGTKVTLSWKRWETLAAACLGIAIILPAVSLIIGGLGGRKNSYSDLAPSSTGSSINDMNAGADSSASADMDDNVSSAEVTELNMTAMSETPKISEQTSGMPEQSVEKMSGSMADAELAADESKKSSNSVEMSDGTKVTEASENIAADADMAVGEAEDSAESRKEAERFVNPLLEDGTILDGIVVEVENSSLSGNDIIYKVVVKQSDKNTLLSVNEKISIICNSDTEYAFSQNSGQYNALKNGESYEVSLRYEDDNGEGSFTVISVK